MKCPYKIPKKPCKHDHPGCHEQWCCDYWAIVKAHEEQRKSDSLHDEPYTRIPKLI